METHLVLLLPFAHSFIHTLVIVAAWQDVALKGSQLPYS